jgi:hypothetical protein
MGQQRLRMTFELGADRREQRIEHWRVVEVIGLAGELERLRIEEPHARQRWPSVTGVLDICDIGGVLHLVARVSPRHVPAFRARGGGKYEESKGHRGDEPLRCRGYRPCARSDRCGRRHMAGMRRKGLSFC